MLHSKIWFLPGASQQELFFLYIQVIAKYIKYLDAGQSVDLTYTVVADINAKPGLYQLQLKLNFESQQTAQVQFCRQKQEFLSVERTDFDVSFSQSTQGQTSLSVSKYRE